MSLNLCGTTMEKRFILVVKVFFTFVCVFSNVISLMHNLHKRESMIVNNDLLTQTNDFNINTNYFKSVDMVMNQTSNKLNGNSNVLNLNNLPKWIVNKQVNKENTIGNYDQISSGIMLPFQETIDDDNIAEDQEDDEDVGEIFQSQTEMNSSADSFEHGNKEVYKYFQIKDEDKGIKSGSISEEELENSNVENIDINNKFHSFGKNKPNFIKSIYLFDNSFIKNNEVGPFYKNITSHQSETVMNDKMDTKGSSKGKNLIYKNFQQKKPNNITSQTLSQNPHIINELKQFLLEVVEVVNTSNKKSQPSYDQESTDNYQEKNIIEILQDLNLTVLLTYLEMANMTNILQQKGPVTIFAPTNEAFNIMPTFFSTTAVKQNNHLKQLLEYHIVKKRFLSINLKNELVLQTLNSNKTLRINRYGNSLVYNQLAVDGANILSSDHNASNGVVHVINKVLYRIPEYSIKQALTKSKKFKTLNKIIEAAMLDNLLSDVAGSFTLFAPTESAFQHSVLGNATNFDVDITALQDIVKYHIVPGTYFSTELMEETLIPCLLGESLVMSYDGVLKVNNATILEYDLPMTNGVLHEIDEVLQPPYYKSARRLRF